MKERKQLSALEAEQVTQDAKKCVKSIDTNDLRLLRAHLLDVVTKGLSEFAGTAQLRGQIAHEEIERRERSFMAKIIQASTVQSILDSMARLPDLEPPEPLRG